MPRGRWGGYQPSWPVGEVAGAAPTRRPARGSRRRAVRIPTPAGRRCWPEEGRRTERPGVGTGDRPLAPTGSGGWNAASRPWLREEASGSPEPAGAVGVIGWPCQGNYRSSANT